MRLQQLPETTDTVTRYDADTVRQVLARATELEQTEQDRLSATQVEELGRELGLNPETIRRALGEVTQKTGTTSISHPLPQQQQQKTNLTARDMIDAAMPGLICSIAILFLALWAMRPNYHPLPDAIMAFLAVSIPSIVATVGGWRHRDLRLGLIGGVATGIFTVFALAISGAIVRSEPLPPLREWLPVLTTAIIIGAITTMIGDYARRQYEARQARKYIAQQR